MDTFHTENMEATLTGFIHLHLHFHILCVRFGNELRTHGPTYSNFLQIVSANLNWEKSSLTCIFKWYTQLYLHLVGQSYFCKFCILQSIGTSGVSCVTIRIGWITPSAFITLEAMCLMNVLQCTVWFNHSIFQLLIELNLVLWYERLDLHIFGP